MKGYVIAEIEMTDAAAFQAYRSRVEATIADHGGRYLVRGGTAEAMEGAAPKRMVVLEFPSLAESKTWYHSPAYQEIIGLRHAASKGRLMLVEGI